MFRFIKNGLTEAKISRLGAELKSLKVCGAELIWQSDLAVWAGSAPILFPFIGRLKGKQFRYGGEIYKMPIHGFARRCLFDVEDAQDSLLRLSVKDDDSAILMYPFKFKLEVVFTLVSERQLAIDYTVLNRGDNEMFFSIGSHPAFALPLVNCALEDYYVEFEESETLYPYKIVNNEYLIRQDRPYLDGKKIIRLGARVFDDNALIFTGVKSRRVFLKNDKTGRVIEIFLGTAPDLGIWSKPGAPFVCVEPWFGHDDPIDVSGLIEEKPGIIRLAPGKEFKAEFSVILARLAAK